nr:SGNH/GDSL hydrolase family protein [Saccharomonospora sp. CUA-673]
MLTTFGALGAAAILAFTTLTATTAPAAAAEPAAQAEPAAPVEQGEPRFGHYVALGDSYTSGPLIPLPKLTAPLGCVRSTANYPTVLQSTLRAESFDDVSCGGAETTHMTEPQRTALGTNAPQLDTLRPDTDLVTVGIGGNDEGVFGSMVGTCPGLRALDPTGTPCRDHFTDPDGTDRLVEAVGRTEGRIAAVLDEVVARSPEATVLVVGYPRITPPPASALTCPKVLPFADGDLAWAHDVETALSGAVRGAAETVAAAGHDVSYVDMHGPSEGHDACAGSDAWIQGKLTNPLVAMSYHPNAAGMRGVAAELRTALD